MKFSYNWLQDFFVRKLPKAEALAELLTLHCFEVEAVEKKGADFIFDLDITPNRADCFSHKGLALEISAVTGLKLKKEKFDLKENKGLKIKDLVKVELKDKSDCLRYTGRLIKDVKVAPSPKELQERLRNLGLEPINNIVDAANYIMLETGQPLHAFDFDKIKGDKIIVRRAELGEEMAALDDNSYKLDKDILVIADAKKPLAIAGIKGGKSSGIDKNTRDVFLEAANFDPVLIRKASQKLSLRTDASLRFEHGLDPELTEKAVDRLASLIQELAKGKVILGRVDQYPKKISNRKIKFGFDKTEKLLGLKISKKESKTILKRLGFSVDNKDFVSIPSFRRDIEIEEDLVEEVGRIHGYNNLEEHFPKLALIPAERNDKVFWQRKVRDFLKENGFTELYNYSFVSKEQAHNFGGPLVELKNPYSKELYYLRPNLLLNLLIAFKENSKNFNELRLFELGNVFRSQQKGINEETNLAGLISAKAGDFYTLKGLIDGLLDSLSLAESFYDDFGATPDESEMIYWDLKHSAEIKVAENKEVGFIGRISDLALKHLGIKGEVFAFEIDFDKLWELATEENEYQPISKFPSAVRDISLLVPRGVKVAEVLNVLNRAGGKLLKDVDLFDIFEGENLPEGKKNLAFHLIFQAEDRTLSSEAIDELQKKIIRALERKNSWQVRR